MVALSVQNSLELIDSEATYVGHRVSGASWHG